MKSVLLLVTGLFIAPLASAKMSHRDAMCALSQGFKYTSALSELQTRLNANEVIVNDPQVCPDATQDRALIVQFDGVNRPYVILRGDTDVDAGIELLIKSGQVSKQ